MWFFRSSSDSIVVWIIGSLYCFSEWLLVDPYPATVDLNLIHRTWSARRLPCRQVNQHTVKLDCFLLTHSFFAFVSFYGTAFTEWLPVVYCYSFMRNSTGNSRLLIKNSSILILSCLCGCATAQPLRRIGTVRSRVCSVAEWDDPVEVVGSFFSINLS